MQAKGLGTKVTSIRVPEDLYTELRGTALGEGRSINAIIVEAIERALEPSTVRRSEDP